MATEISDSEDDIVKVELDALISGRLVQNSNSRPTRNRRKLVLLDDYKLNVRT